MMTYLFNILQDGFFAAIAAIGFASISNPPRQAYKYCALIAALGHATRYVLTHNAYGEMHLIGASFIASLVIGVLTVFLAPRGCRGGRWQSTVWFRSVLAHVPNARRRLSPSPRCSP